jgi:hypothetical protein
MNRYFMIGAASVAVAALAITGIPGGSAELRDGEMLDETSWERARELLPEEILAHYQHGEYANRIADLSLSKYIDIGFPPEFRAASEANLGRFEVNERGTIVERATGRQPPYIMGLPFPEIDPNDPSAGVKILWNFNYVTWYGGDDHFVNELVMLGESGIERRVQTEVRTRVYDGAPEARDRRNPDNLALQRLAKVLAPADLEGMASLTWRFRDPDQRDALWTFVPGMRRVRQVSPLNRSDGFLGSDICMDDGPFFEAKPEDFEFRLIERRDMLILMDPYSIRGEAELARVDGGWRIIWKDTPRIGADLADWRGVPWAPVGAVLVRRPVWVVDAVPRDANYLYGRIVLRFDAETYRGTWATKYDRADQPIGSYQASSGAFSTPDGGATWIAAGGVTVRIGENLPLRRATVILFPPGSEGNPSDFHVDNSPALFSTAALLRQGK